MASTNNRNESFDTIRIGGLSKAVGFTQVMFGLAASIAVVLYGGRKEISVLILAVAGLQAVSGVNRMCSVVRVEDDGIRCRSLLGWRFMSWSDLAGVNEEQRSTRFGKLFVVVIVRRDGRSFRPAALAKSDSDSARRVVELLDGHVRRA
jgi:hypothetical protein